PAHVSCELQFEHGKALGISKQHRTQNPRKSWGFPFLQPHLPPENPARGWTRHEAEQRAYYHDMFWVAYPVGLVALVVGLFFPVQAVGAGLLFGGLISLGEGCYSYRDRMDGWLRFGSLVVALLTLLVLGSWRSPATFALPRRAGGGECRGRWAANACPDFRP